jgi:predicted nucleotidyltransferase
MKDDMEKKLNVRIDLIAEQFVHPKLKPQIMNDLKIIYSNEQ